MTKLRGTGGFTLVELVVVMIILATLSAIIIPQLGRLTDSVSQSAEKNVCHANQRILDSTTVLWRTLDIENNIVPDIADIQPMLATPAFCPSGGKLGFNASRGIWTCNHNNGQPRNDHDRGISGSGAP